MVIHREKLRWLFWLRWKMFTRSFTRGGASRIIGVVLLGIIILAGCGALAVPTYLAYRDATPPINSEVLFLVLSGIYLLWIILPLLQISTNEGLDLSKLSLFPLTRGELMASLLFSTLLDIPVVGLLIMFGAVVAGWGITIPLLLLTLLTVIIFYVQLIGISQLVLAVLQPFLQSRRFRDLTILLTVVLAASGYMCQFVIRGLSSAAFIGQLTHAGFSPYLQWLPPGMAARAIQQASLGNWGLSVAWLGALLVVSLAVLYLWMLLVEHGMTASAESGSAPKSVRRRRAVPAADAQAVVAPVTWSRFLPPQVSAMLVKDLKYAWRDPQVKALMLQSLVYIVFPIIAVIYPQASNSGSISRSYTWIEFYAPNVALLALFTLSYNALGFERQSLTTLFLFPIAPKYILWGKNLMVIILGLIEILVMALVVTSITHQWNMLPATLTIGLSGIGIVLAIGNFTSIFFPQRMRMAMRGFRTSGNMSTEEGCLRSVTALAAMIVTLILLIPVILGVYYFPFAQGLNWLLVFTIPASLIYGWLLYFVVTTLVAPRMLSKAPEILAVVTRE